MMQMQVKLQREDWTVNKFTASALGCHASHLRRR
jgi:hypothetical protein